MDLADDACDGVGETDVLRELRPRLAVCTHDVIQELLSCRHILEHPTRAPADRRAPDLLAHRAYPLARASGVDARVRRYAVELARSQQPRALVGEGRAPDGVDQG